MLSAVLTERQYDAMRLKRHAARKLGRQPNTESPETFNDHMLANMLKHERWVLKDFVADKEFAKIYVRGKCPEMAIPQTYAVLRSEAEIRDYEFPQPCMVKPTHTMGGGILHRTGEIDRDKLVREFRRSYYEITREPHYKHLDHKIIVEELLSENGETPPDWKVHCFFGEPRLVQVISGRGTSPKARFYTTDWDALPISLLYPLDEERLPRPAGLEDLLGYARVIAKDFEFCRVDAYLIDGKVYFGEITPYHGGASQPWRCASPVPPLQVDRALAPLFETADADPRLLLSRAGLIPDSPKGGE